MRVSYRWLRDYVDVAAAPQELGAALTMTGFELESLERIGQGLEGVVAARIESVQPHPNAERLNVCAVNDNSSTFDVVCGAPGLTAGQVVALARPGSTLPNGTRIERAEVRGVMSYGMLCAADELGLFDDHSALYRLPDGARLGQSIAEAAEIEDWVLEINIAPNRPDMLSMVGVAREVAARFGLALRKPEAAFEAVGGDLERIVRVDIEDPERCPRYTGLLVRDVKIGPSPQWMVARLNAAGVRSINNVVDVTNFVMLECGQPLHAFDLRLISGGRIIVRRAAEGERIVTLDEVERPLSTDDLLICDGHGPVALAGVMGGLGSGISELTRDVFIESAYFEPTGIRRTSRRAGLASESSFRFERGVDYDGVPWGLHRAGRLMAGLAGGKLESGYIDNRPADVPRRGITLRPGRANQVLGLDLGVERMASLLRSIELGVERSDAELRVSVPTFRVDLAGEADLWEELARLHGYDDIPATLHSGSAGEARGFTLRRQFVLIRQVLAGCGLTEAVTLSFISPRLLDALRAEPDQYVRLQNPLSEDLTVLRDTLVPSLLLCLARNAARGILDAEIFELRRVFRPAPEGRPPDERYALALAMTGSRAGRHWSAKPEPLDLFDLKGVIETLLETLKVERCSWRRAEHPAYMPGACAELLVNDRPAGAMGKLTQEALAPFNLAGEVFATELDAEIMAEASRTVFTYQPVSRFPSIGRDLAVIVDNGIQAGDLLDVVIETGADLLKSARIFDLYRGAPLAANEKSIAISCTYQTDDRTLTDEEVDRLHGRILDELKLRMGARFRQ